MRRGSSGDAARTQRLQGSRRRSRAVSKRHDFHALHVAENDLVVGKVGIVGQTGGDRMSRHHYDVARLYHSSFGTKALADGDLLKCVVRHKSLFFQSAWANYQSATPGTFRLVPPSERFAALTADYRAMQENMIFGQSYSFNELIAVLAEVEVKINAMVGD